MVTITVDDSGMRPTPFVTKPPDFQEINGTDTGSVTSGVLDTASDSSILPFLLLGLGLFLMFGKQR